MDDVIEIKKYPNRRLYDTGASQYVNLRQIADRIRAGARVHVVDARDGTDLTQPLLLQILLEGDGARGLLPVGFLHRVIRMTVDHPLQRLAMGQLAAGLQLLEEQLDALERHMGWPAPGTAGPDVPDPEPEPEPEPAPATDPELEALRAKLAELEARLRRG